MADENFNMSFGIGFDEKLGGEFATPDTSLSFGLNITSALSVSNEIFYKALTLGFTVTQTVVNTFLMAFTLGITPAVIAKYIQSFTAGISTLLDISSETNTEQMGSGISFKMTVIDYITAGTGYAGELVIAGSTDSDSTDSSGSDLIH